MDLMDARERRHARIHHEHVHQPRVQPVEQQLGRTRGSGHDTAEKNSGQERTADHRGEADGATILVRPQQTTGITGEAR